MIETYAVVQCEDVHMILIYPMLQTLMARIVESSRRVHIANYLNNKACITLAYYEQRTVLIGIVFVL